MSRTSGRLLALAALIGCKDEVIALEDPNNFAYTGLVDLPTVTTAEGVDVTIDWSGLVTDLQCHGMDPGADVDNLLFIRFPAFDEKELEDGLSQNTILQSDQNGYVECHTEDGTCASTSTSASLSAFNLNGNLLDVAGEYVADGSSYLLTLNNGTIPGVGARGLVLLQPSADSENTYVQVNEQCGVLDFSADLSSLEPAAAAAEGPWVIDWSGLTEDGLGNPIQFATIDQLLIARYADLTVADLEESFLDLELLADDLWTFPLQGSTAYELTEDEFPGFTGGGTWILGLRCTGCFNPAPVFVTVLETEE